MEPWPGIAAPPAACRALPLVTLSSTSLSLSLSSFFFFFSISTLLLSFTLLSSLILYPILSSSSSSFAPLSPSLSLVSPKWLPYIHSSCCLTPLPTNPCVSGRFSAPIWLHRSIALSSSLFIFLLSDSFISRSSKSLGNPCCWPFFFFFFLPSIESSFPPLAKGLDLTSYHSLTHSIELDGLLSLSTSP